MNVIITPGVGQFQGLPAVFKVPSCDQKLEQSFLHHQS